MVIFALFIALFCCGSVNLSAKDSLKLVSLKEYSTPFELKYLNFACLSIECSVINLHDDFLFHIVVGTDHASSVPLLVNRVCEAYQKCVKKENIKFILHSNAKKKIRKSLEDGFRESAKILNSIGIPFTSWNGVFTADKKMLQSFEILEDYTDKHKYIYHTDIDEIPEPVSFGKALLELESGQCDGIRAEWIDRLATNGALKPIRLDGALSISEQFPLRCNISSLFVGARTEKIIVYRANYRIDGGQHEIWCAPLGDTRKHMAKSKHSVVESNGPVIAAVNGTFENRISLGRNNLKDCLKHIEYRKKTENWHRIITKLPKADTARYCPTVVKLDHFKLIDGLKSYLQKRIDTYKFRGMAWWTDSWRFLTHIDNFNNSVCVDCDKSHCFNTISEMNIAPVVGKKFTCTRNKKSRCITSDGVTLKDIRRENRKEKINGKDKNTVFS